MADEPPDMATSRLRIRGSWLRMGLALGSLLLMSLLLMQARLRGNPRLAEPAQDPVLALDTPLPAWVPAPTFIDISGRCTLDTRRVELVLNGTRLSTELTFERFRFQRVLLAPGPNVLEFSAGSPPQEIVRKVEVLGIPPPHRVLSLEAVKEGSILRVESVFAREQAVSMDLLADDTNEVLARVFQPVLLNSVPLDRLIRQSPFAPTLTISDSAATLSKSIVLSRRANPVFEGLVLRSRDGFPLARSTDAFIVKSPGLALRAVHPLPGVLEDGVGRWQGSDGAPLREAEIRVAFSGETGPLRLLSQISQHLERLHRGLPAFLLKPGPELLVLVVAFLLLARQQVRTLLPALPAKTPVPRGFSPLFDLDLPQARRALLLAEWLVAFALVIPLIELLRLLNGPLARYPQGRSYLVLLGVALATLGALGGNLGVRKLFPAFHSRWGGLLAIPGRALGVLLLVAFLIPAPAEHSLWGLRVFIASSLLCSALAPVLLQRAGRGRSTREWGLLLLLPGLMAYGLSMPSFRMMDEKQFIPSVWDALTSSTALPEVLGHAVFLGLLALLASASVQQERRAEPWLGALLFAGYVVGLHDTVGGWPLPALLGLVLFPTVLLLPPARREALLASRGKVLSLRKRWLEELPVTWLQQLRVAIDVLGAKLAKGELSLDDYLARVSKLELQIAEVEKRFSFEGTPARELVFAHGPLPGDWENAKLAMRLGGIFFLPVTLAYSAWGLTHSFTLKGLGFLLIFYTVNLLASAALFGFFFSVIRGNTGLRKALWASLVTQLCLLPAWLEVLSRTHNLVLFFFSLLHSMVLFLLLGLCFDGLVARSAWGEGFRWRNFLGLAGFTTVTASVSLLGASVATTFGSALTGQLSKTVVQLVGMSVGASGGGGGAVP